MDRQRMTEEKEALKVSLSNWLPVGRITDPVQRRAAQARLAELQRKLGRK